MSSNKTFKSGRKPKSLISYVRKGSQPIGTIVALNIDGKVFIGWSKRNKVDNFVKTEGKRIAFERAIELSKNNVASIPHALKNGVVKMGSRAILYFKTLNIVSPPFQNQAEIDAKVAAKPAKVAS